MSGARRRSRSGSEDNTPGPATSATGSTPQIPSFFSAGFSRPTSDASASDFTTRPVMFGSGSNGAVFGSSSPSGTGFGSGSFGVPFRPTTTGGGFGTRPAGGVFGQSQQNISRGPSPSPQPVNLSKASTTALAAEDFASVFSSPVITIKFSCTKKQYRLHQDALVSKSGYFKHMLSSGLREQHEACVELRYTEPFEIAFRAAIQFMYHGDYNVNGPKIKHALGDSLMADHIYIYVLADRLMMPELKTLALAKYLEMTASVFPPTFDHALEHISVLVPVLYGDVMEEEIEEGEDASTEQADTITSTKPAEEQEQDENFHPAVEQHVSDVESDPRRGMQKAFVEVVRKRLADFQDKTAFRDLICDGGPFVLDLFMPSQTSGSSDRQYNKIARVRLPG